MSVEMMQVTLRVVCRALLDLDIGREATTIAEGLGIAVRFFRGSAISLLLPFLPTRHNRELNRAIRSLRGLVDLIIADRTREGRDHGDLLAMLLAARDADSGQPMAATQVRDEVLTLLLAGHETTANALAWTFFLLANTPAVETKLHDELDCVLAGRTPSIDDLPRLPYTEMVIQEAMRLYPPAWAMSRAAIADDVILGYRIPAGSVVMLSQWVTHRHPDFWEEPLSFRPERFTPEEVARRSRYAYFPFGGGPRLCIGEQFALVESRLILATMAQNYRLRLHQDHPDAKPVEPEPLLSLRPRGGISIFLEPITRAAAA